MHYSSERFFVLLLLLIHVIVVPKIELKHENQTQSQRTTKRYKSNSIWFTCCARFFKAFASIQKYFTYKKRKRTMKNGKKSMPSTLGRQGHIMHAKMKMMQTHRRIQRICDSIFKIKISEPFPYNFSTQVLVWCSCWCCCYLLILLWFFIFVCGTNFPKIFACPLCAFDEASNTNSIYILHYVCRLFETRTY